MTRSQERMVARIRREAETLWDWGVVKRFEVDENEYFVNVIAEVGSEGDEGTLAEVFCRDKVQAFIFKRGRTEIPVSRQLKSGEWKHYYKKYKSFLDASIEQKKR